MGDNHSFPSKTAKVGKNERLWKYIIESPLIRSVHDNFREPYQIKLCERLQSEFSLKNSSCTTLFFIHWGKKDGFCVSNVEEIHVDSQI